MMVDYSNLRFVAKIFLPLGCGFLIISILAGLPPQTPPSEPGFNELIIGGFFLYGLGFLILAGIFLAINFIHGRAKGYLKLMHNCSSCNTKVPAERPALRLCSSCNRIMNLAIQCKNCLDWLYVSSPGEQRCPHCNSIIFLGDTLKLS